jgi:hypothetical protein
MRARQAGEASRKRRFAPRDIRAVPIRVLNPLCEGACGPSSCGEPAQQVPRVDEAA